MAPAPIVQQNGAQVPSMEQNGHTNGHSNGFKNTNTVKLPLEANGSLDNYNTIDLTPCIGREFPTANLVDMMNAPNSDELLTELALTISQRGVVWFRAQDNLTNDLQKRLIERIGQLSGRPSTSGLHIHPVLNTEGEVSENRDPDQEISTISSKLFSKIYGRSPDGALCQKKQSADQWHSDIAFEPVPADFSSLRLTELPKTGGDTLWASGYELYDRLSPPMQKFLESLTCTFGRPDFIEAASRGGFKLYEKPRGAVENTGGELRAIHPVIRTHPVTGWRSLYPVGQHCQFINGVTEEESEMFLSWFKKLLKDNHDLQVRFRWQNVNDIAIWDNRCTFHCATFDFMGLGDRSGNRAVGCGERPYFDPNSKSRSEAMEAEGKEHGKWFMIR